MCYKTSTPNKDQLEGYFQREQQDMGDLFTVEDFTAHYVADGFTMPQLPFTTADRPTVVASALWKLLPHWVKTGDEARKYANTLNATCEDIFEKASYRSYIGKNRGLLWVNGFFEGYHPTVKQTIPYYIHAQNNDPFTLGCVYTYWLDHETGEYLNTFSIITTPANELMSKIHNTKKRMPLIIPASSRRRWLGTLDRQGITEMMQPLTDGFLTAYRVSNDIYKKGIDTNTPAMLAKVGDYNL
ncbi:MAG: SOS response-associated peptidase [Chitinophagia bacterium]|nr:SOS response-associated peptidase [Chitinophagia bacterium]